MENIKNISNQFKFEEEEKKKKFIEAENRKRKDAIYYKYEDHIASTKFVCKKGTGEEIIAPIYKVRTMGVYSLEKEKEYVFKLIKEFTEDLPDYFESIFPKEFFEEKDSKKILKDTQQIRDILYDVYHSLVEVSDKIGGLYVVKNNKDENIGMFSVRSAGNNGDINLNNADLNKSTMIIGLYLKQKYFLSELCTLIVSNILKYIGNNLKLEMDKFIKNDISLEFYTITNQFSEKSIYKINKCF